MMAARGMRGFGQDKPVTGRTGNRKIRLFVVDHWLFEDFGELCAEVSGNRSDEMGICDDNGSRKADVVGGATEYLSMIRACCWKWIRDRRWTIWGRRSQRPTVHLPEGPDGLPARASRC